MSKFLTSLQVEQIEDNGEDGRGTWRLLSPLVYQSDVAGITLTVPAGFVTDFASIPRIPLIFDWLGDRGNLAATLHDWLYTKPHPLPSRDMADEVLHEALVAQGIGLLEAESIYLGARLGGENNYE